MAGKKKRKPCYKKTVSENIFGMFVAGIVIVALLVFVSISNYSLRQKQEYYMAKEEELKQLIIQEQKRTQELEEYATYTQTKKFVEEVAKEKLGLVYENEIIFKDEH